MTNEKSMPDERIREKMKANRAEIEYCFQKAMLNVERAATKVVDNCCGAGDTIPERYRDLRDALRTLDLVKESRP